MGINDWYEKTDVLKKNEETEFLVARLEARNFFSHTKENSFEGFFQNRDFRNQMTETVIELMNLPFDIIYGYTAGEEISLLFHPSSEGIDRSEAGALLAGAASAKFSLLSGESRIFTCRISRLPALKFVEDYFLWREADAFRNALNYQCVRVLRSRGYSMGEALAKVKEFSAPQKHTLLMENKISLNLLPQWQKNGIGFYRQETGTVGCQPGLEERISPFCSGIKVDQNLPYREEYSRFIRNLVARSQEAVNAFN